MADLLKKLPIQCEPKKDNRFIVEFPETKLESWAVAKMNKPTYSFETGWSDITIEMRDPIGPSTTQAVYDGIIVPHMRDNKIAHIIYIKMLDPVGVEIETWKMRVMYKDVDFGNPNYSENESSMVKLHMEVVSCVIS